MSTWTRVYYNNALALLFCPPFFVIGGAEYARLADALARQSYCAVGPGDCLYLPRGVHHHVFSEADADDGFNLALNVWIDREATVGPPAADDVRLPTLEQVARAMGGGGGEESCAEPGADA